MKKTALSVLLAATLMSAAEYKYEISPVVGYVFTEDNMGIKDHAIGGVQMQFNDLGTLLKPELSLLYSDADYKHGESDTDIFRAAINGVYEYENDSIVTPFAKIGLGYEALSHHANDNHNSLFADAGGGVKINFLDQLALKFEALYMLKFNDFRWDNNLALLAGLSYAFGEKAQPAAPAAAPEPAPAPKAEVKAEPAPLVAAPKDSDRDGVFDDKDQCPNSPAGYPVDAKGCNIHSDKDGVLDPADKCPDTPQGFKVDNDGCPLKATLHLNFAFDSNKIVDADSTQKVTNFATFMKESPAYKASITGHTDSIGAEAYNQKLSEKRAATVKSMLVDQGDSADRLSTDGKGEMQPIATNKTKEGRAENRRIEVELSH